MAIIMRQGCKVAGRVIDQAGTKESGTTDYGVLRVFRISKGEQGEA